MAGGDAGKEGGIEVRVRCETPGRLYNVSQGLARTHAIYTRCIDLPSYAHEGGMLLDR
jgi:hypothetical protein